MFNSWSLPRDDSVFLEGSARVVPRCCFKDRKRASHPAALGIVSTRQPTMGMCCPAHLEGNLIQAAHPPWPSIRPWMVLYKVCAQLCCILESCRLATLARSRHHTCPFSYTFQTVYTHSAYLFSRGNCPVQRRMTRWSDRFETKPSRTSPPLIPFLWTLVP